MEIFWFSQVILRGTCHRHVTGHTNNEYEEQVKSRGTSKNFHLNFHLWKCGHPIQISIWSVTCFSLVQEDMSHGIHKVIHKWNFFFCNWTLQFQKKKVSLVNHLWNHLGHVLVHKWRTSDAPYRNLYGMSAFSQVKIQMKFNYIL